MIYILDKKDTFVKKTLFLSLLLIPAATQCMKITRHVGLYEKGQMPLNLYNPKERYVLTDKFGENFPDLDLILYHQNHNDFRNNTNKVREHQFTTINNHSLLSFAAIAYNPLPSQKHKDYCKKTGEWTEERASYQERKSLIKFLLQQGYKPTKNDRTLAYIIEREEGIRTPNNISDLLDQCLNDTSDESNRE